MKDMSLKTPELLSLKEQPPNLSTVQTELTPYHDSFPSAPLEHLASNPLFFWQFGLYTTERALS